MRVHHSGCDVIVPRPTAVIVTTAGLLSPFSPPLRRASPRSRSSPTASSTVATSAATSFSASIDSILKSTTSTPHSPAPLWLRRVRAQALLMKYS